MVPVPGCQGQAAIGPIGIGAQFVPQCAVGQNRQAVGISLLYKHLHAAHGRWF